jgi:CRP-like cAMP-binding protein
MEAGGNAPGLQEIWQRSFLRDLSPAERAELQAGAVIKSISPGTRFYHPLRPAPVMLIRSGLARIKVLSVDGRAATIRLGGPGQFFGIHALFTGSSIVAAEAATRLEFWDLDVDRFHRAAKTNAHVAYLLARSMAQSTEETLEMVTVNIFGSVRQRVGRQLLDLGEELDGALVVRAGHQDIADSIGSVREVVARALRALKDEGLITRVHEGLLLLDPAALQEIAADDG